MFAVNIAIHQFCLQLTILCGFAVNSSYRDIIDYRDYLQRISQNIAIMFFGYYTVLHTITLNVVLSGRPCCIWLLYARLLISCSIVSISIACTVRVQLLSLVTQKSILLR